MFSEIHQLKQIGLKKAQVARKLEIDVKTVNKYWEATPDDFAAMRQKGRSKKLKHYRDVILKWIRDNPDICLSNIRILNRKGICHWIHVKRKYFIDSLQTIYKL